MTTTTVWAVSFRSGAWGNVWNKIRVIPMAGCWASASWENNRWVEFSWANTPFDRQVGHVVRMWMKDRRRHISKRR